MRISTISRFVSVLLSTVWAVAAHSELQVAPLAADNDASILELVQKIAGPNVRVLDGSDAPDLKPKLVRGGIEQIGAFTGGREWVAPSDTLTPKSIGIPSGLILSTGKAVDAQVGGSIDVSKKSTDIETSDDASLPNPFIGIDSEATRDLVFLEFYVIPENENEVESRLCFCVRRLWG